MDMTTVNKFLKRLESIGIDINQPFDSMSQEDKDLLDTMFKDSLTPEEQFVFTLLMKK